MSPPSYEIYSQELVSLGKGYALWEPDPSSRPQVELGDVGYIRDGGFHRLFNIHLQPDDPHQPSILPQGFEVLPSEPSRVYSRPLRPGAYCSNSVRSIELAGSISVPTVPLSGGLQFSCSRQRGAVLAFPNDAQAQDAHNIDAFKRYMLANVDSWLSYTQSLDLGLRMEGILLVTGRHLTTSWAVAAFTHTTSDATIEVDLGGTVSAAIGASISWKNGRNVEYNWGPDLGQRDDHLQDQCIFIRGLCAKRRPPFPGLRLKAAAEPKDLEKNQDDDNTQPGVRSHDDSEVLSSLGDEETLEIESFPEVHEDGNILAPLLDYILENSNVDIAIAHHDDVKGYLMDGWKASELSSPLSRDRPYIRDIRQPSTALQDPHQVGFAPDLVVAGFLDHSYTPTATLTSQGFDADADCSISLKNLADAVIRRFQQSGQVIDLKEAIFLDREALMLRPASHPDRSMSLRNLADAVLILFEKTGQVRDLEEAISIYREDLMLRSAPHPDRSTSLRNLAVLIRFQQTGQVVDLEEVISLYRNALILRSAPHSDRSTLLNNMANAILIHFQHSGQVVDLEEAILLHRESLVLRPASHPDRSASLNNLANAVLTRFRQTEQLVDLEEAISLHRESLMLRPAPHPDRSAALNNLANALQTRFEQTRQMVDLEEAISLYRESLMLRPISHPDRSASLSNLANAVLMRFRQTRQLVDLEEAISLYRDSLVLRPAPHPARSACLNNLANAVLTRFGQTGQMVDLDEAILLHRESLVLRPASHSGHSMSLNDLANAVLIRFQQTGQVVDLEEAISLLRDSLILRTAPHPDRLTSLRNLANAVLIRFQQTGQAVDLEEAISLYQEALMRLPPSHPAHCLYLTSLASSLCDKFGLGDMSSLEASMNMFRTAANHEAGSVFDRLDAAQIWARRADIVDHPSALEAYLAAIQLLPRAATLTSVANSPRRLLADHLGYQLYSSAAACAIRLGQFEQAVEMLEEGRSIFWSQALQLRTSIDGLHRGYPELAKKLQGISLALERNSFDEGSVAIRTEVGQVMTMKAHAARFRRLNEDWVATLEEVRALEGFTDFLRPKKLAKLKVAVHGPVVLLNASESSCDALIITSKGVGHAPLHPQLTQKQVVSLAELLSIAVTDFASFTIRHKVSFETLLEITKPSGEIHLGSADDVLRCVLSLLWEWVVHPVIRHLNLEKSDSPPRVWWCPTGPFAVLPLHAAGIYTSGTNTGAVENISDYMVSSYIPTLNSLLTPPPAPHVDPFQMLVAIQPKTLDQAPLTQAREEMRQIEKHVPASSLIKLGSLDVPPSTVAAVLSHLPQSSIAHFSCRGIHKPSNPLESALLLDDGPLSVSTIMAQSLPNASLAFLSASQTAMGDVNAPGEAMNLATAMLFSGFHGVVATMWPMHDIDGPKIADEFYAHLFKGHEDGSAPDTTEAARALHLAVNKLRAECNNGSFMRWVPFVHYGL